MANTPNTERILAIVNLIVQYLMEDDQAWGGERAIVEELMQVGFAAGEIDAAFDWITHLSRQGQQVASGFVPPASQRIFTPEEWRALGSESIDFLLRLRRLGLVDDLVHEEIVEKALEAADEGLRLEDLKVIAALLVLARTQQALRHEFDCILEDDWSRLYH